MSKEYTLHELENETCSSFGGNNCVLHGCMFGCVLAQAKKRAAEREGKKLTDQDYMNIKKN